MKLKLTRTAISLSALLALGTLGISITTPAHAIDETSTATINVEKDRVIVKGHDVVAYFTGKAVKGDKKFAAEYMGATYFFASEANKKAFQANPAHYAPQYGGFCAMGVALGKKLDVDPSQFVVHNDKLYLNVNADVFKKFSQDVSGNVQKADSNWPGLKDKAPNTL